MAGLFDGLSDFIYRTGENVAQFGSHHGKNIAKDPVLHTAAVIGGNAVGGPLGAGGVETALSRAEGKSYDESLGNGAMAAGGSYMLGGGSSPTPTATPTPEYDPTGFGQDMPYSDASKMWEPSSKGMDFMKLSKMMPKMGGSGGGQQQQQPLETVRSNPNPFAYMPQLGGAMGGVQAMDTNYLPERQKAAKLAAMLRQE